MEQRSENSYDPAKDLGATVRFLNGIQEKMVKMVQHLDTQTNILIGISSAVFIFSISKFQGDNPETALIITGFASAFSALIGLLAIHPPRFMRKKGQKESLMYNRKISGFPSPSEYENELAQAAGNRGKIIEEYSLEIYNLARYYYRPKRELFKIARSVLFAGLFAGLAVFLVKILLN